jgi:hypothetical protein
MRRARHRVSMRVGSRGCQHRVTGFVVDDEADAVRAIGRLGELDRRQVRAGFEQRFTVRRMAEEYLRYYEMVIGPKGSMLPLDDLCQLVVARDRPSATTLES